jgi:exopolysaccharide biosynthesis polyprenyl glycosylphosphotransferase
VESSAATTQSPATYAPRPPAAVSASPRARHRSRVLSRWLLTTDMVCTLAATALVTTVAGCPSDAVLSLTIISALTWVGLSSIVGLYADDDLRSWVSGVSQASRALVATFLFSWPVFAVASELAIPSPGTTTVAVVLLTAVLSGLGRAGARGILHRSQALRQRVLIVGSGVVAGQLATKLRTHVQFGLVPIGLVDDDVHPVGIPELPWLGPLDELTRVLEEQDVDRVIIAFTRASHEDLLTCIRTAQDRGIAIDVIPRLFELLDGGGALDRVGGLPLLSVGTARLGWLSQIAKRGLDLVLATLGLIVVAPLLAVLAVAIRAESNGPVFFRQRRVGRNGKEFWLIKLRSMYVGADAHKAELAHYNDIDDGVMFKIHHDPRVTRVGGFLRRLSLDELPQLLNVIKGDMSLVGPRPLIVPENDALTEDWHHRRLELRPGLTGAWQIYGRSESPFDEMVRFDYQYVAGWSLARDVEILLATVPAVLSGRGAY